ncbi:hypothetical protein F5888DRAFT_1711382 [Russula emetica]|nr:hypothetical protein F5888DRAFT_1711382 [Russula emetica]
MGSLWVYQTLPRWLPLRLASASLWWLPHIGCLSYFVRAEPPGCTRHDHAPMPSSCQRWPPTPLDSAKSCLPYTSGRSYGHEAMPNVRGVPLAAVSEHWLGSLTGV